MWTKRLDGFEPNRRFRQMLGFMTFCALVALTACEAPNTEVGEEEDTVAPAPALADTGFLNPTAFRVPHDVDVPSGPNANADTTLSKLASFAWEEFIALNWPSNYSATTPTRGQPDSSKTPLDFTQPGNQTLVWQSYMHRVEVFPAGVFQDGGFFTYPDYPPSYNTPPKYFYRSVDNKTIPACGPYNPQTETWSTDPSKPPLVDLSLFNNLDETTEINLATMFVDGDPKARGRLLLRQLRFT